MFQADAGIPLKRKNAIGLGMQLISEAAVHNGGNYIRDKTYFPTGVHPFSFGTYFSWENERLKIAVNYNRITSAGRYLFPREWGTDPFFTYLPL